MSYGCMDEASNNTKRYVKAPNQPCPRIPRFSNANYMYNKQMTGEVYMNNVRMIERAAPCIANFYASTELTYCPSPASTVGDGICQNTNQNVHNCLWEGGDCCIETCIGPSCPTNNDYCKNPHVLIGSTIVNSFQGQCMDINNNQIIVSDCRVDSSIQKPSQLWYYNKKHHTIHSKSLSHQYCLSHDNNQIIMQSCDYDTLKLNQQWCFYQKATSTRIIPFEYCEDGGSSNIFDEGRNVVMRDGRAVLEDIHWNWDFSNSNWLFADEFF